MATVKVSITTEQGEVLDMREVISDHATPELLSNYVVHLLEMSNTITFVSDTI